MGPAGIELGSELFIPLADFKLPKTFYLAHVENYLSHYLISDKAFNGFSAIKPSLKVMYLTDPSQRLPQC